MSNKSKLLTAADLMPHDTYSLDIMRKRAEQYANLAIRQDEKKNSIDYIKFQLGKNESYGVPFHCVKEVIDDFNITSVPHTQNYIAGVMNWRGHLLTLIELSKFFEIHSSEGDLKKYILAVESKGSTMGILTSNVEGSDQYDPAQLEPALLANGLISKEMVMGLHRGITTIINIDEILSKINSEVARRGQ